MKQYDAIVIGGGQAGPFLAAQLAQEGKQVALIEGHRIGGSCVNYGCIPTKTLIASARAIYMAGRGDEFGVSTGPIQVNFARVMERKNKRVHSAHSGMDSWMRDTPNINVFDAWGTFEGTVHGIHHVRAGDTVLESDKVFINTGTSAFIPPISGLDRVNYLDNEGLLNVSELPEHLLVLGGGYVGLELGQAFRRFGSQVTVIEAQPKLVAQEDDDIAASVKSTLDNEGVTILLDHRVTVVSQSGNQITLTLEDGNGKQSTVAGSHLLVAVGRKPNTTKLNLEAVGVETDERGYITVDDHARTNVPGIWALGDVNGRGAFTHTSYQDHEIVLDNLRGGNRSLAGRIMAYGMYIDPPLGRVGISETQARESGRNILMATKPMSHMSRALEQGETQGLMKILVDGENERIVGAAVLGYHGDDVVQVVSYFMATGASYKVMKNALPIHPTISEFLPTLLGELEPLV